MKLCRIVLWVLIIAYLLALGLFVIGTLGLFGSPSGPLAGVYLVPLGVPWVLLAGEVPDRTGPWLAVAAPLLNILIVWVICRAVGSRTA